MQIESANGLPVRHINPELKRTAQLYRRVDHGDPMCVRREIARRLKVSRLAGIWTETAGGVDIEDTVISAAHGRGVAIRIYRSVDSAEPRPSVLYIHGGAFISGDLDFEHPRCLEMCRETGFTVVCVDYRLAPESPYPAGLDDCMTIFQWLCGDGSESLAVDPTRIAIVGTSAGGTLAAAVCLKARDIGLSLPRLQMLLYPAMDDRLETPSMREFTDTPTWDYYNCVHMWNHYLGPVEQRDTVSPYAAPARASDLSGLPMAYIMTAEYDPLRDEGIEYALRLLDNGVLTELHQFSGTFHGFDTLASSTVSQRARRENYDVLRAAMC